VEDLHSLLRCAIRFDVASADSARWRACEIVAKEAARLESGRSCPRIHVAYPNQLAVTAECIPTYPTLRAIRHLWTCLESHNPLLRTY